jgi:hypothetical protein
MNHIPSAITLTRLPPTKMGYNITFYKISRRKEGGGGKGKYKTSKNIFGKLLVEIFLRFKKVRPTFELVFTINIATSQPGTGDRSPTWSHLSLNILINH